MVFKLALPLKPPVPRRKPPNHQRVDESVDGRGDVGPGSVAKKQQRRMRWAGGRRQLRPDLCICPETVSVGCFSSTPSSRRWLRAGMKSWWRHTTARAGDRRHQGSGSRSEGFAEEERQKAQRLVQERARLRPERSNRARRAWARQLRGIPDGVWPAGAAAVDYRSLDSADRLDPLARAGYPERAGTNWTRRYSICSRRSRSVQSLIIDQGPKTLATTHRGGGTEVGEEIREPSWRLLRS